MSYKKIIIILSITIFVFIGIILGSSYAWYAYSNAESRIGGSTIKETPTVIFAQTEYIVAKTIMPIKDEDRYNYANKNSFSITIDENLRDYETAIEISLKDINMDNELKIPNYKYELLQDGKLVSNGNFSNINNATSLKIMPMTILKNITYPQTYTYELYIWLSDDDTNQNDLMNKGFSAKINVNSATKK